MAKYVDDFPEGMESNFTWGSNGENVGDLRVLMRLHGDDSIESISCWELSETELEEVRRTGKVYLHVFGGHPAVYVGTSLDLDAVARGKGKPAPLVRVYLTVPGNHVIGLVEEGVIPRTPHRIGFAVAAGESEWRIIG